MSKAQPSPEAVLEARVACLNAAMEMRTPGTPPEVAVNIAETFWRWVNQAEAQPETTAPTPRKRADNREAPPAR